MANIFGFKNFSELMLAKQLGKIPDDAHVLFCRALPDRASLSNLPPTCRCPKCNACLSTVSAAVNSPVAAVLGRCATCLKEEFYFITSEPTSSVDIIVIMGPQTAPQYVAELNAIDCRKCGSRMVPRPALQKGTIRNVVPVLLSCESCKSAANFIFWDTPLFYFEHCVRVGSSLIDVSPEAAVVFYVAAVENFLQKTFLFAGDFNIFLVERRRVSFQQLREARDIFDSYFGVDISKAAGVDNWTALQDAVQKRHYIVHNAGHDKNFAPVAVTIDYATKVQRVVEDFAKTRLDPILRRKMVY